MLPISITTFLTLNTKEWIKCDIFLDCVFLAVCIEIIFSIWLTWANGRCYKMFVFAAGFSFPEGRLSHLLATDYLLSQNSLLWHTHRNEDADIHGCTTTQTHMRRDFIWPLLIPPLGVIVHGCVCFLGPQTQTVMGRGGGSGGRPYKDEVRCCNNCLLMVQWLFLQFTRPLCI